MWAQLSAETQCCLPAGCACKQHAACRLSVKRCSFSSSASSSLSLSHHHPSLGRQRSGQSAMANAVAQGLLAMHFSPAQLT